MRIPLISPPGFQLLAYECHEGNYMLGAVLGGERAEDKAIEEDAKKGHRPRAASQCRRTSTRRLARRPERAAHHNRSQAAGQLSAWQLATARRNICKTAYQT